MASISTAMPAHLATRSFGRTAVIYLKEAKYEFLKYLRLPVYSFSITMFPVMFYILFGLVMNRNGSAGNLSVPTYLLASYATFGVLAASLFANGAGVAADRGLGWMQVKRASPMPAFAYFFAKLVVSMIFSTIVLASLMILGFVFGHVRISPLVAVEILGILLAGTLPLCALGLAIGYFAGPNSAPAVVNMVYLPMSFASGLWFPIEVLPKVLQKFATLLPSYHLVQLVFGVLGAGHGSTFWHWGFLLGFTAAGAGRGPVRLPAR